MVDRERGGAKTDCPRSWLYRGAPQGLGYRDKDLEISVEKKKEDRETLRLDYQYDLIQESSFWRIESWLSL
jgi:hypothetical protein